MTFLGGIGHTLPFLCGNVHLALSLAFLIVGLELLGISAIRHRYFKTPMVLSLVQVLGGGALVLLAGILFGSA